MSKHIEINTYYSEPTQAEYDAYNEEVQIKEYLDYLRNTDWYYARKMEIGKEVPADVVAKRIEAREYLNLRVTNE